MHTCYITLKWLCEFYTQKWIDVGNSNRNIFYICIDVNGNIHFTLKCIDIFHVYEFIVYFSCWLSIAFIRKKNVLVRKEKKRIEESIESTDHEWQSREYRYQLLQNSHYVQWNHESRSALLLVCRLHLAPYTRTAHGHLLKAQWLITYYSSWNKKNYEKTLFQVEWKEVLRNFFLSDISRTWRKLSSWWNLQEIFSHFLFSCSM